MSLREKIRELRYLLDLNEVPFSNIPDEFFTLLFPSYNISEKTKEYLESHGFADYQKLEWLGDSVLELIMRSYMFQYRNSFRLGQLNDLKQKIVSNYGLHCLLNQYEICRLSDNEEVKQCADILESIIGILYYSLIQQDIDPVFPIMNWFVDTFNIEEIITDLMKNEKSDTESKKNSRSRSYKKKSRKRHNRKK
jgi:dsRNA-specific ribonuclease